MWVTKHSEESRTARLAQAAKRAMVTHTTTVYNCSEQKHISHQAGLATTAENLIRFHAFQQRRENWHYCRQILQPPNERVMKCYKTQVFVNTEQNYSFLLYITVDILVYTAGLI